MAVITLNLPQCDVCGEVTLPSVTNVYKGISARKDIRAFDAARRRDGVVPFRCGKCKSPNWDREFTGDRRRKDPHAKTETQKPSPAPAAKRCAHGLIKCPQCITGG